MTDITDTLEKHATTALEGKRVLLTGGSTGIGRAILVDLAREGAELLTFARNQEPLAEALRQAGLNTNAGLTADVSVEDDLERVFAAVDEQLGGIDILICNAALGADDLMKQLDWRYVVQTNLMGYMACTHAALERMIKQGSGHIVLISSVSADIPSPGESVYAATKAGIDGFAVALRQEVKDKGVAVSVIAPGAVGTDMQPYTPEEQREQISEEQMLFAEDIADAVHYVLTRAHRVDVFDLRIEPRRQDIPSRS
jgi:3-hydroxy acid dehydrogenase / malonic semialdehyde reductase